MVPKEIHIRYCFFNKGKVKLDSLFFFEMFAKLSFICVFQHNDFLVPIKETPPYIRI